MSGQIHTTARRNSVDPHSSFVPPTELDLTGGHMTPRRKGFTPLSSRINPPAAPSKPVKKTAGTLTAKTAEAFQRAIEKGGNLGRSSSLRIERGKSNSNGVSYLGGKSALEALALTLSGRKEKSPRNGAVSPSFPSEADGVEDYDDLFEEAETPPLERLSVSPPPPTQHLQRSSPVPRLKLQEAFGDVADESAYGMPLTLDELNNRFGRGIPLDYELLDPMTEDLHAMQPFLSPVQIASIPNSDLPQTLRLGRCTVTDEALESICIRNPRLTKLLLFNCTQLKDPSFLDSYSELEALCLSWCSSLSKNFFEGMKDGSWPKLHTLQMAMTSIDVQELPVLPSLTTLDLSHCQGLTGEAFADLIKHPILMRIRIEGANVTDEEIRLLKEKRPGLEIIGKPKRGLDYYLRAEPDETDVEITLEAAENYPFLRRFMFEVFQIDSWTMLSELEDYKVAIQKFFEQEFKVRDLDLPLISLETPQGWFHAERVLHEHEWPNLSSIMSRLVPMLKKEGYFKKPKTPADLRSGKAQDEEVDCFMALWEMTYYPRMLNKITDLDLSGLGLTEIPRSFCRLYFSQLKTLTFARNRIRELPRDFIEEFPKRKVDNYFSKYPQLEVLDFTGCELTSIEGVFSFLTPSLEEPDELDRVSVLPNLRKAIFTDNEVASLPKVFGISSDRVSQKLVIDLKRNDLTAVHRDSLEDLGSAKEVGIVLDLRDNTISAMHIPSPLPKNVSVLFGPDVDRFINHGNVPLPIPTQLLPDTARRADLEAYELYERKE